MSKGRVLDPEVAELAAHTVDTVSSMNSALDELDLIMSQVRTSTSGKASTPQIA